MRQLITTNVNTVYAIKNAVFDNWLLALASYNYLLVLHCKMLYM